MLVEHQSQLLPEENKFHRGNGADGKHYWLTPPELYAALDLEYKFDFDPCRKKGPTAWVRKAIEEHKKGKTVVLVYPIDKWVLMLLKEILGPHAKVRNLGDVRWLATEDGSRGKGTGRHIACFILETPTTPEARKDE